MQFDYTIISQELQSSYKKKPSRIIAIHYSFFLNLTIAVLFAENTAESVGKGLCRANGEETGTRPDEKGARFSLPPFGLATYKTQGSLWNNPETGDNKRMVSLFSAADSWLKQLGVQHHDFNYFITHPI